MTRALGLLLATILTALLFYLSRFWEFRLWRGQLLDIQGLRSQGDLVAHWTRGTDFAPFSLLLWFIGAILLLTVLNWIWTKLTAAKTP